MCALSSVFGAMEFSVCPHLCARCSKIRPEARAGVQVAVVVILDLAVLGYEQLQYMQGKVPFQ